MKNIALLFTLTVNLFCFNLEAQNDTAYFDDGSMVIGKNVIKVSIEGVNIVIDVSGITDFVPVDTITRILPGVCDLPDEELSPGVFRSCGVYHEPEFVRYAILRNGSGATKEVRVQEDYQLIRESVRATRVKKHSSRPTNELQKFINGQWQTVNW